MKWTNHHDVEKYLEAKEYIDTIIMPLSPFGLEADQAPSKIAYQKEVLAVLTKELEQELSGRTLLIPSYTYWKSSKLDEEIIRINQWLSHIQKQPFEHIFLITFDATWKKVEKELNGNLLWFPHIQTGELHSSEMQKMIREQVSQISELIRSYW
ncbi:DUF2487 family protein [Virgibacillus soli]|uniref:DUF2487 family protein n=1 Tax=Paracerasibacillus soli TaxID=480284 RepID=A0ABU5CR21_9BACI|nr:DUF2487 family protein [Virgibacillus soli]MDY0408311.1 DUF2487 family protein [Virgibacillus soli]